MKKYFYILFTSILSLFVYNCASIKSSAETESFKDTAKPYAQKLDINYIKLKTKEIYVDSINDNHWVDSIYNQMTFDEKVGQLFMVAAYSNKDEKHFASIDKLITENKLGGLIFFQGGPVKQAKLTNRFQKISKIPLFVGIDAEWGLSMRLDSTYRYPYNMTLGAIKNLELIEKVGKQMGKQSKRLGIHFNFSPVLDINTNPQNPIIGNRSFGEDKNNVTNKAIALMNGLRSEGIFSTGKHFPGHGDTATDSHLGLPSINFDKKRLDSVELYPYKKLFEAGLESVMVAHLNVPSLESKPNTPSSISYNIVTNLLKKELNFKGLIFTDALNMKGASSYKSPGEIDLAAFLAGNDILLFPENVPLAFEKFREAYNNKTLTDERLEYSVKKILEYKYKAGLNKYRPIETKNLYKDLNQPENDALHYALYENAITLLKNDSKILPIKDLQQKIAYVKLGDDNNEAFVSTLKKYTEITEFKIEPSADLNKKLSKYDVVIIGFHKTDKAWKNQEFTQNEITLINDIAKKNKVILDVFAKPYTLLPFQSFNDIETLLVSYQNNPVAQEVSAEIIFGAVEAKGMLPVSIKKFFFANKKLTTTNLKRLGFASPEYVGMNSQKLLEIDAIAKNVISKKIAPGMQILVARKGKVIYQKSFGFHTYDSIVKVKNTDLYDVASITKMVATLPLVMQQFEKKKINLDTYLGNMLPIFKNSDKDSIPFKDLLTHNARLQAWIPFYKSTLDSCGVPMPKYYSKTKSREFSIPVSHDFYLRHDYKDSIIKEIVNSKLLERKRYVYSDFTFIILKEYIEHATGKPLDKLSAEHFFAPMGMTHTLFNPLDKFPANEIAPTEIDNYFRYSTLQGYVHDMAAAMFGGVSGHAGVFSNSLDIAKMMQLFLQEGTYGNQSYFLPETFETFNTCYYCEEGNRRGLGFDKPQLSGEGPTCGCVSHSSFGHTGFTGTIAWADPETELIYVFLSNRTFPNSNARNKLAKENIREDIQKIIQEAIIDK
jgi:beta-N-acetylhexosaminidase